MSGVEVYGKIRLIPELRRIYLMMTDMIEFINEIKADTNQDKLAEHIVQHSMLRLVYGQTTKSDFKKTKGVRI